MIDREFSANSYLYQLTWQKAYAKTVIDTPTIAGLFCSKCEVRCLQNSHTELFTCHARSSIMQDGGCPTKAIPHGVPERRAQWLGNVRPHPPAPFSMNGEGGTNAEQAVE